MKRVQKAERRLRQQMQPVTTEQAAEMLGHTAGQVRALIRSGELPATRKGRGYMIHPLDIRRLRLRES